MKQKNFYMLALICCMSFLLSAKESNYKCYNHPIGILKKQRCAEKSKSPATAGVGFDLSPLQLFVFNI